MTGGRPTVAEVDLRAVRNNVRTIRSRLLPSTRLLAVVKADGYGHGAAPVAEAAIRGGAEALGVALAEEGVRLREAGITAPILVLGPMLQAQAAMAVRASLAVTVYDEASVRLIGDAAAAAGARVPVHLKIDTGMGRLGVMHPGPVLELAASVLRHSALQLEGLMTHLASADEEDGQSAQRQWSAFLDVVDTFRRQGIGVPFVHGANSAATLRWPGMQGNQVRVGLAIYGVTPGPAPADLTPALSVRSAVAQVKRVGAGFAVGYGETFRTEKPAILATVPIGYADGYRRALSNRGEALIAGVRARVAGRVSMDQTVFVLPEDVDVRVGDDVILLGRCGAAAVSANDWAGWADTIPYEVFCGLSARVPRLYRIGAEIRHQSAVDANFWAGL